MKIEKREKNWEIPYKYRAKRRWGKDSEHNNISAENLFTLSIIPFCIYFENILTLNFSKAKATS